MNSWRSSLFAVPMLTVSSVLVGETNAPTDEVLIQFAQQRTNTLRVTDKPVRMFERVASLCKLPAEEQRILQKTNSLGNRIENPHRERFVHVYVTAEGAPAMRIDSAVFPRGTIILKEKFEDTEGQKTEMFTGMIKRGAGYNSECGDWEFFTMEASGSKIVERGKVQRCMDCHVEYKSRDFVTKNYVSGSGWGARNK